MTLRLLSVPVDARADSVRPGDVITIRGSRKAIVAVIAKGRLVTSIDLLTLGGFYARSVTVPSDSLVRVHAIERTS